MLAQIEERCHVLLKPFRAAALVVRGRCGASASRAVLTLVVWELIRIAERERRYSSVYI